MGDLSVNKVSAVNSEVNTKPMSAVKEEEEVSVFTSKNEDQNKVGGGVVVGSKVKGNIDGKDFALRNKDNLFSPDEITGTFGGKSVYIEQKGFFKKEYNGKIGEDEFSMTGERKSTFSNTRVYQGSFKGQDFKVQYIQESRSGDMRMIGKYGDQQIDIEKDHKTFSKDKLNFEALPEDFAPVAAVIFTARSR